MRKLVFIILAFLPIFLIVTIGLASKVISQRNYIYVESVVFVDEDENEYPKDKIIKLSPGDTFQLYYKIYPELATNQKVSFMSDRPELVSVNENGELQVADDLYGTTYITLQTECGNKTIRILISVVGQKVISITLPNGEFNVKVGWQHDFDVDIHPYTATNKKVHWSSSDPNVCTVDLNGVVKAVGAGTAIITATSDDDPTIQATVTIHVTENADIIFVIPNPDYVVGTTTNTFDLRTLVSYVNPEYENNLRYRLTSYADKATIDGSILTFKEGGNTVSVEISLTVGDEVYSQTYTILLFK